QRNPYLAGEINSAFNRERNVERGKAIRGFLSLFALNAAIIRAVAADAVNDVAAREWFEAEQLAVERIHRHGFEVVRHECVERGRQLVRVREAVAFDGQRGLRVADASRGLRTFCEAI